jgi:sugar O-acyltransferase (sialic acid O-acetyltransferase NeuD family)
MKKTDLVVFGTGGHAKEVSEAIFAAIADGANFNFLGFLDQSQNKDAVQTYPVFGDESWLKNNMGVKVVVAIGNPKFRRVVVEKINTIDKHRFQTIIHPKAYIGNNCNIGAGAMIFAGSVLTCDIFVGNHVVINIGTTVSHEVRLEDFVTLAPQCAICGAVSIETGADVGAGVTVIQGKAIGAWSVVGAGAVVIRDIPPNVTAVGNPAKAIKERLPGWHEA